MNDFIYTFTTEPGDVRQMTLAEYQQDPELKKLIEDKERLRFFLGLSIFSYDKREIQGKKTLTAQARAITMEQLRNPLRFYAPNSREQLNFINDDESTICAMVDLNRSGKALSLDTTSVVTPSGHKPLSDVKVGDLVIARDGRPYPVLGVYDQGERDCYRMHFGADDITVDADANHIWWYLKHTRAYRLKIHGLYDNKTFNEWEEYTTEQIYSRQGEDATPQRRGRIPRAHPAEHSTGDTLIIPPYTMGALLGDGGISAGSVSMSSVDNEILRRMATELWWAKFCRTTKDSCTYRIGPQDQFYELWGSGRNPMIAALKHYKLWGKKSVAKFVPKEYLFAPTKDRIDLLRGLMDTDGSISTKGRTIEFCSISPELSRAVQILVRSLGGKVVTSTRHTNYVGTNGEKKIGQLSYRLRLKMWDINPFHLPRKANLFYPNPKRQDRIVRKIERIGKKQCRCIEVASPDKTFLVNDYIVTHNTTAMYIKALVRSIKCKPEWEIFTEHGVEYHEFQGPESIGLVTYNIAKLKDPLWKEMIKKWTPDDELGIYGRSYTKRGRKFGPSWGHDSHTELKKSHTILGYYTYEMDQGNYEGGAVKRWLWDEQGRLSLFDGADRGIRTTDGVHYFALTPHKVRGRPDTGAAGWLCPVLTGKQTMGHTVSVYTSGDIREIPDWIYPDKSKRMEIAKWETEPVANDDKKRIAEGRARLYGEWHTAGGRVLDEWDANVHWIEPLWKYPPADLSLYRGIDHGLRNPTACVGLAVDRYLNIYVYREYYQRGKQICQDVQTIIREWGNEIDRKGEHHDIKSGMVMPLFEERFVREGVWKTALDGRSFSLPEKFTGKNYGWLYRQAGLRNLIKASGKHYDHWVPMVNMMLYNAVNGEQGDGLPKLYVFNNCLNLKREIEGWVYQEPKADDESKSDPEKPVDKDNHAITALGYAAQIPLRYLGNVFKGKKPIRRDPKNYWADPNLPKRKYNNNTLGYRRMT